MTNNKLSTLGDPDWMKLFKVMQSPDVSECQVNGKDSVWVKHKGKRFKIDDVSWDTDEEYAESVEKALGYTGFIKSDMKFERDGALFEGPIIFESESGSYIRGRAHIVLPPASDVPLLTFAKKSKSLTTLDAIADNGSMNQEMLRFMKASIHSGLTIALSGGTGAGKTTFIEACTKLFASDERIAICEDTPELELVQNNVGYMHSLPWRPGMDPNNVVTLSWIVQQVNRMRTDRVIVGETRGKEFADFLVAANSGMEGSMTTIHADNPSLCLSKMSNFALKGAGENMPMRSINADIANAIDLIVQIGYEKETGQYYTYSITEVTRIVNEKTNQITVNKIYELDPIEKVHQRVIPMSDELRVKMKKAGIDPSEFVGASVGSGTEPTWLKGFGPASRKPQSERTISNKSNNSSQNKKPNDGKEGKGLGRTI